MGVGKISKSYGYLASHSCSEAKDLPEKQHIGNFLEDLYFLITMTVAELTLSPSHEPNG